MNRQRSEFISTRQRPRGSSRTAALSRNQNLTAFMPSAKLGPVSHTVLVVLLVAFLGLMYLTQLTRTSAFAYEMNEVNQIQAQLTAEHDDLRIENARLQSLTRVQQSAVAAEMTTPVSITYAE